MLDEGGEKAKCLVKMKQAFAEGRTGASSSVLAGPAASGLPPTAGLSTNTDFGARVALRKRSLRTTGTQTTLDHHFKKQRMS